jgi:hypothetical protein
MLPAGHDHEQTFESRRENLSQANKLSRIYAVLLDALQSPPRQRPAESHGGASCDPAAETRMSVCAEAKSSGGRNCWFLLGANRDG